MFHVLECQDVTTLSKVKKVSVFWQSHTCLPQSCIFGNKNHQNPEQSIIFWNASANISSHLWNKSGCQILRENHRDGFAGAQSIDSAMLSLNHKTFFTNGTLIQTIYSACSFADAMFSSGNFRETVFLLCVFGTRTMHLQEQICIFLSFTMRTTSNSGFGKFQHKSFSNSLEKSERLCLFVLVFLWMRESGTLERLSIFLERPTDFDDFPEQILYSCNGRHVCRVDFYLKVYPPTALTLEKKKWTLHHTWWWEKPVVCLGVESHTGCWKGCQHEAQAWPAGGGPWWLELQSPFPGTAPSPPEQTCTIRGNRTQSVS